MARISIGDVFELPTAKGKAYLHYVHKMKNGLEMVRVLKGLHQDPPASFDELVAEPEQFVVGFPLNAAFNRKIVHRVASGQIVEFSPPEFMRTKHKVPGEFDGWQIVNTSTMARKTVKSLSESERSLSPSGIWNDTLLIERLESGWTLEEWK
jgi:hypothetical protein